MIEERHVQFEDSRWKDLHRFAIDAGLTYEQAVVHMSQPAYKRVMSQLEAIQDVAFKIQSDRDNIEGLVSDSELIQLQSALNHEYQNLISKMMMYVEMLEHMVDYGEEPEGFASFVREQVGKTYIADSDWQLSEVVSLIREEMEKRKADPPDLR